MQRLESTTKQISERLEGVLRFNETEEKEEDLSNNSRWDWVMSPKRVYVMYCAEILQSNERIKKKNYRQLCGTRRLRETGPIVKMASLDLSLQLALHLIKFLSLSYGCSLISIDICTFISLSMAVFFFFLIYCSNM